MTAKKYAISNPSAAIALRYGTNVSKGITRLYLAFADAIDDIEVAIYSCAFYDEMCSGEGGCVGQRNGERKCDGCSYFEIDGNNVKSVIDTIKESMLNSGPSVRKLK